MNIQLPTMQFRFRYLVLELCAGTLAEYLIGKYKGPMPADIESLHQMAAGVQHIHSQRLVHRDLKPENVLISKPIDSRVHLKISDFGYSKGTSDNGSYSLESGIKGTPSYLAPELLQVVNHNKPDGAKRGTTKSDVFALGCVFYKFLTRGSHPFGEDAFILYRIFRGESNLQSSYNSFSNLRHRRPENLF